MFFRPSLQPRRISKTYDAVYVDSVGEASGWLPIGSNGQRVNVTVSKASLQAIPNINPSLLQTYEIIVAEGYPNGVVILEMKLGGQPDASAVKIAQFDMANVAWKSPPLAPGFYRLRLTALAANNDPMGIYMTIGTDAAAAGRAA